MAQRPLLMTIGTAFAVGYAAVQFGSGLDTLFGPGEPGPTLSRVEAVPMRQGASAAQAAGQRPTLTVAADSRGQFMVHPSIDSLTVRMLVDTGASLIALRHEDAVSLGVRPAPGEYTIRLQTANGSVRGARVNLREVRLGAILVRNVEAVVLPQGALGVSLLGTSFLGRLQGYEVQTGRLILRG